jgi:hypothetical protein
MPCNDPVRPWMQAARIGPSKAGIFAKCPDRADRGFPCQDQAEVFIKRSSLARLHVPKSGECNDLIAACPLRTAAQCHTMALQAAVWVVAFILSVASASIRSTDVQTLVLAPCGGSDVKWVYDATQGTVATPNSGDRTMHQGTSGRCTIHAAAALCARLLHAAQSPSIVCLLSH